MSNHFCQIISLSKIFILIFLVLEIFFLPTSKASRHIQTRLKLLNDADTKKLLFSLWKPFPNKPESFLNGFRSSLLDTSKSTYLTFLVNFLGLDLAPVDYPIIIQKPVPVLSYKFPEGRIGQLEWTTNIENNQNQSTFSVTCLHSPVLLDNLCQSLNWKRFGIASKPWNHQVSIWMFPPDLQKLRNKQVLVSGTSGRQNSTFINVTGWSLPKIWLRTGFRYNVPGYLPTVVSIQAFLTNRAGEFTKKQKHLLLDWIKVFESEPESDPRKSRIRQYAQYFMLRVTSSSVHTGKSIPVIEIKVTCLPPKVPPENQNCEVTLAEGILNGILANNPKSHEMIHAHVKYSSDGSSERVKKEFEKQFSLCSNNLTVSLFQGFQGDSASIVQDYVAKVTHHLATAVLSNLSYSVNAFPGIICLNGKLQKFDSGSNPKIGKQKLQLVIKSEPEMSLMAVASKPNLWLEDPFSALGFVSCGGVSIQPMEFQELFKVYDVSTWMGLVITMATGVVSLCLLSGFRIGIQHGALLFFSIFLELGIQIRKEVERKLGVRFLLGTFLLLGIVISNGYKNTNVYNVITPRKPFLYERIDQLIQHRFTIFSRSKSVKFFNEAALNVSYISGSLNKLSVANAHLLRYSDSGPGYSPRFDFLVESELEMLYERHVISSLYKVGRNEAELVSKVYNNSKMIHSVLQKMYQELVNNTLEVIPQPQGYYRELEERLLIHSLKKCEKTALIFPVFMNRRFEREVGKNIKLNFGKETYFEPYIGIEFEGVIPPTMNMRARRLRESGTVGKWLGLVRSAFSSDGRDQMHDSVFRPVVLNGNVLVLFVLLSFGLMVALIAFFMEIVISSFQSVIRFFK